MRPEPQKVSKQENSSDMENVEDNNAEDHGDSTSNKEGECTCRNRNEISDVIRCDMCLKWFHETCVGIVKIFFGEERNGLATFEAHLSKGFIGNMGVGKPEVLTINIDVNEREHNKKM